MRFVCISDTHNRLSEIDVPEGDVLIHAGDATMWGRTGEISKFVDDMSNLPHEHKVFVPGNHDFNTNTVEFKLLTRDAFTTLIDEPLTIGGIKLYGAPWVPNLQRWAYYLDERYAEAKWLNIPNDTDILVTHGPPGDVLDKGQNPHHYGCKHLLNRVLKVKPKYHVFGHIHSGYGEFEINGTRFINASICDEEYDATQKPIVFDL